MKRTLLVKTLLFRYFIKFFTYDFEELDNLTSYDFEEFTLTDSEKL